MRDLSPFYEPEQKASHVPPHAFTRRSWRFWICDWCYAPRSLHPRLDWVRQRLPYLNQYLSKDAPHFDEGW